MSFNLVQHLNSHIWNQALHPERDFSSHTPKWLAPARFTAAVFKTWATDFWRQKSCGFLLFSVVSHQIFLHLLTFSAAFFRICLSTSFLSLQKPKSEAPFATMFPSVTVPSQVLARYALFCSIHRFVALWCKNRCSENAKMLGIWPCCLWSSRSHKSW